MEDLKKRKKQKYYKCQHLNNPKWNDENEDEEGEK